MINSEIPDAILETADPGALVPNTPPAIVEVRGLSKRFGATRALVDGSLSVAPGEVVALLGENGSGKSTLVKLLSGVLSPDDGQILVQGAAVRLRSPRAALAAGIVTVFQEILAARDRSVLDNLWLGHGSPVLSRSAVSDRRRLASQAWLGLSGQDVDLDRPLGELTLMEQQICVVVRALLREPKLLVLDESTSTLDVELRDRMFDQVRRRAADGMGCLFISHRMDEVMAIADRFVALRTGQVVGVRRRGEADARELIRLISGRDVESGARRVGTLAHGSSAVRLEGVSLRPGTKPFSATVSRGEIVGLAGLEGHGQDELIRCLAGLQVPHAGQVYVAGPKGRADEEPAAVTTYRGGVARGVVYVPRDRKVEGMADVLPIIDNYSMPTLQRDRFAGVLSPRRTKSRFQRDARTVNFTPGRQDSIGRLSGGNQQKVIIARWLAAEPRVILLNDPTRGVDLKTKHELYEVFRGLADAGAAVVMLSSEVDELVHLMDRVLVFHDGSLSAELAGDAVTPESLVSAYFGSPAVAAGGH
ncbi:MAG: ribose transport system ATP-binding protein [Pseudonocardiales bacterium]|nr:ribose transport system ATP-binding protein [Pseudonocardiales bacterium]